MLTTGSVVMRATHAIPTDDFIPNYFAPDVNTNTSKFTIGFSEKGQQVFKKKTLDKFNFKTEKVNQLMLTTFSV